MIEQEIARSLVQNDNEFVPPLSSRYSTKDTDFDKGNSFIQSYLECVMSQKNIFAFHGNQLVGFLSYVEEELGVYVSTIIVDKDFRSRGVGKALWQSLLKRHSFVTTRTWSTNTTHISLLKDLGFRESKRIMNDRGSGIDTVYFEYSGKPSFADCQYDTERNCGCTIRIIW